MYKGELEPNPEIDALEMLKQTTNTSELLTLVENKIETSNDYYHFVGDYNTTKSYWERVKETIINKANE